MYVTVDAEPVEKKVLVDKLQNAHMNNEKAISQEMDLRRRNGQYGGGISYRRGRKKDELEDYLDQVDENDELGLYIGLLVVVAADSPGWYYVKKKYKLNVDFFVELIPSYFSGFSYHVFQIF